VTASTTVAISCAATLKVKQISPERNFEEKLKGKKKCLVLELMQIFEILLHQWWTKTITISDTISDASSYGSATKPDAENCASKKETAEASHRQSEQGEGFHSRLPTIFYTTVLSLTNRRLRAKYFHSSFATSNSVKRSFVETWEKERENAAVDFFCTPGLNGYHLFIPPRFRAFGWYYDKQNRKFFLLMIYYIINIPQISIILYYWLVHLGI